MMRSSYSGSKQQWEDLLTSRCTPHALHLLSIIAEEIDLVLVDVNLEKTERSFLLSALKEQHPNIPVIAMTDSPETATLFGTTEVLMQPISAAWKHTNEQFRSHRREQK
jgi:DNA-binding NtrC family response regulator